jgi:hypothetical protein
MFKFFNIKTFKRKNTNSLYPKAFFSQGNIRSGWWLWLCVYSLKSMILGVWCMSIDSILAILAKSTSDNEAEASLAVNSAYKRMQKEGVSIFDLLDRPKESLYQSSLNRLAERIATAEHPEDSIRRRETLEKLFYLIGQKFIPDGMKGQGSDRSQSSKDGASRADEAQKAYDEAQRKKQREAQQKSSPFREEVKASPQEERLSPRSGTLQSSPLGRMTVPHLGYLRTAFVQELAHDLKNTFLLFAGAIAFGFVLDFAISVAFAFLHAPLIMIQIAGFVALYIGATSALNFALWKHKGYSWSQ